MSLVKTLIPPNPIAFMIHSLLLKMKYTITQATIVPNNNKAISEKLPDFCCHTITTVIAPGPASKGVAKGTNVIFSFFIPSFWGLNGASEGRIQKI